MKIPPGIAIAAPPLNEKVAVKVIGSPSSSIKKEQRSIVVRIFNGAVAAKGAETNLGLSLVIINV